jgi:hypothetical protein
MEDIRITVSLHNSEKLGEVKLLFMFLLDWRLLTRIYKFDRTSPKYMKRILLLLRKGEK